MNPRKGTDSPVDIKCGSQVCSADECFLASFDRSVAFGTCKLDDQLRIVCAHGALLQRLPRSTENYIGKRIGELDHGDWPSAKRVEARLFEVLSRQKAVFFEAKLPSHMGGSACVGFVTPSPVQDTRGHELLCVLFDISSCEAVRAIKTEVASELAFLAHELRNPLATISSGLKILEMHPSAEDAVKARQMMGRQVRHAVTIVRNVFDLARIRDGELPVEIRATGVGEVVDLALEISCDSIKRGAHTLKVAIDEELPPIDVDKSRLAQALSNLLDNASKYTPSGGIISLEVSADGDHLVLRVSDTGLGISEDRLAQIFELFAQVGEHAPYSRGGSA